MLTVSIDESGFFEAGKGLVFNGGLTYEGEDYKEECIRLEEFFKNECKSLGLEYPNDLHTTDLNKNNVPIQKKEAFNIFKEHFTEYIGQREGYRIICMLKGKASRGDYRFLSNIVDDANASNLYEHMACQFVNNLMLHNILIKGEKVFNLNIATRVYVTDDESKMKTFRELGYNEKEDNNGRIRFYLTDQKTFKTAISSKIMDLNIKDPIEIDLNVKSIEYVKKNDYKKDVFLYGADLVCGIIRQYFDREKEDFGIEEFSNKVKENFSKEVDCWVYDDIDGLYNGLLRAIKEKNYIKCAELIYDIENSSSAYRDFYVSKWIRNMQEKVNTLYDSRRLDSYINTVQMYFDKDNRNYEKGRFLAERLYEIIKDSKDYKSQYRVSDMLLRANNHCGNVIEGRKWLQVCEDLREYVPVESYIETINRSIEIDVNLFDFKTALHRADNLLEILNILNEYRNEIGELMGIKESNKAPYELRGKVLSSLGQFYSFVKSYEKALKCFEEALEEFTGTDNMGNRRMTLSFILHLAISSKNLGLYSKYEAEYFGSNDMQQQLDNILNAGKSKDYMLYVYVKALNYFYGENADSKIIMRLQQTDYERYGFQRNQHPWELIYKNMAEIYYKNNRITMGNKYIDKAVAAVENKDLTIDIINNGSYIIRALNNKDTEEIKKSTLRFIKFIQDNNVASSTFDDLLEFQNGPDYKELAHKILNKFTYMYA